MAEGARRKEIFTYEAPWVSQTPLFGAQALHCVSFLYIWHHVIYHLYAGKYSWSGLQDVGSRGNW